MAIYSSILPPPPPSSLTTAYSEERLALSLNSDLADTLGNLVLRVTSEKLNPQGAGGEFSTQLFPLQGGSGRGARAADEDYALVHSLVELPGEDTGTAEEHH